jgi:hypothetical protein
VGQGVDEEVAVLSAHFRACLGRRVWRTLGACADGVTPVVGL